MKTYIAGPMSGIHELNFPRFHAKAKQLRAHGREVINPAEINPDLDADWLECMICDIKWVATCDSIYMLDGWENSPGAKIERLVAEKLKLKIEYEEDD